MDEYEKFIAGKRLLAPSTGIARIPPLNDNLFPFQRDIVAWALKRGRAAIWEDCGLGKSLQALDWARVVCQETDGRVLILTPPAVAPQFVREGAKFGIDVVHAREANQVGPGISVTNYERLHKFDPAAFIGIVLDESSILKDYTSATRNALIEAFARTPFKLCCTATPSPNDYMELGNHSEFLGVMSRSEMLSMFFVHDGGSTQDWRLKGHAHRDFWRWVTSWAVAVRRPSDLGYDDAGYTLQPLSIREHVVKVGVEFARSQGALFALEASGLSEQREARRASLGDRVRLAAEIVAREPGEPWLIWCDLNQEGDELTDAIPGAVQVSGADSLEDKENKMAAFIGGVTRVIVTKPSVAGMGLNLQNCARTAFVGLSHSFEAWYQAIRRVYRFGQKRPVECHMITSDAEGRVADNLRRKQVDAEKMVAAMVREMEQFSNVKAAGRDFTEYRPRKTMTVPNWVGREDA